MVPNPTPDQIRRYANDGVYLAEPLLTQAQLEKALSCYDYVRANPAGGLPRPSAEPSTSTSSMTRTPSPGRSG